MTTDRRNNRSRGRASLCAELLHANAGLRCHASAAEGQAGREPLPIWLSALMATTCQASVNGEDHDVRWDCIAGRALYTNRGTKAEHIEPLGVQLQGGHTVAVYWRPGESNYTVEVYSQSNHYRA